MTEYEVQVPSKNAQIGISISAGQYGNLELTEPEWKPLADQSDNDGNGFYKED